MKTLATFFAIGAMALGLTACGSDKTVIEKPVVVTQPATSTTVVHDRMSPNDVENTCANGYDNATHRCY